MRIVVAGATGSVGRAVIRLARASGIRTLAIGRDAGRLAGAGAEETRAVNFADVESLQACINPGDVVFSSLGASASPSPFMGRKRYRDVDVPLNRALIEAAVSAKAARFQYVSLAFGRDLRRYAFAEAHEQVVDAVVASGLPYTILRPTGIFSTFRRLWGFARLGVFPIPGKPDCRSNPIHEDDIAQNALDQIHGESKQLELGGPEVFTRREIGLLMCRAAGWKHGATLRMPNWFHLLNAHLLGIISPRVLDMLRFYLAISIFDNIAPVAGQRRLADYYAQAANGKPGILGGLHRSGW